MKAKKKIFVALLFLLTLVFAACGKKANTDSKEADAGKTGKEVEVYFFHRWPNEPKKTYFDEMAKKFSEKHPNVKIRIERVINDSYKEKSEFWFPAMTYRTSSYLGLIPLQKTW